MKTVTSAQMREYDRVTIEEIGVPGEVLMERAGRAVAEAVNRIIIGSDGITGGDVFLAAGHGNNGGDAFVAARLLYEMGCRVEVCITSEYSRVKGDALLHLDRMLEAGVDLHELTDEAAWAAKASDPERKYAAVVDGVLGTGISGSVRGVAAAAIKCINALSAHSRVVAIDVPSGMNADSGEAEGDAVRADFTVTMGFPKTGMTTHSGVKLVGSVTVADIGIPGSLAKDEAGIELISGGEVSSLLKRRGAESHKGSFGHLLVVGGASGYAGAAAMAAKSAVRSGVGLVSVLTPASVAGTVAGLVPEAMVKAAVETEVGSLSRSSAADLDLGRYDAILIGPGMTTHEECGELLMELFSSTNVPLVLDADALNLCVGRTNLFPRGRTLVTPHPGEMARLIGSTAADVQSVRTKVADTFSSDHEVVVALKGAGTVVASPGEEISINLTGNPGMASGGTGDVLGGLAAGFAAQGMGLSEAAKAAVFIHGLAGDTAALRMSQAGLAATDLINAVPAAFLQLCGR